jgi:hypothetical protein
VDDTGDTAQQTPNKRRKKVDDEDDSAMFEGDAEDAEPTIPEKKKSQQASTTKVSYSLCLKSTFEMC